MELCEIVTLLCENGVAGDVVDWGESSLEFGVSGFPSDYRQFIGTFGAGGVEDNLSVLIPRPGVQGEPLTVSRLRESDLLPGARDSWQDSWAAPRPELRDMIVWGETVGADALCWVASAADPDKWPVAVWERQGGGWALYDCGMAEFILRVLRADFPRCPLSDASLWGRGSARFLNFRDEDRLWDQGIDPWEEI